MQSLYRKYKRLLDRVPDDIILSVGSREIMLESDASCLVGWVVREGIARIVNVDPTDVHLRTEQVAEAVDCSVDDPTFAVCTRMYGGNVDHWRELYFGVTYREELPDIERAFVNRIEDAINN